jgi:hypothetical protein
MRRLLIADLVGQRRPEVDQNQIRPEELARTEAGRRREVVQDEPGGIAPEPVQLEAKRNVETLVPGSGYASPTMGTKNLLSEKGTSSNARSLSALFRRFEKWRLERRYITSKSSFLSTNERPGVSNPRSLKGQQPRVGIVGGKRSHRRVAWHNKHRAGLVSVARWWRPCAAAGRCARSLASIA